MVVRPVKICDSEPPVRNGLPRKNSSWRCQRLGTHREDVAVRRTQEEFGCRPFLRDCPARRENEYMIRQERIRERLAHHQCR